MPEKTSRLPGEVLVEDPRPLHYRSSRIELEIELDAAMTLVRSKLFVQREPGWAPDTPLRLDGLGLELLDLRLDGEPLAASEWLHDEAGLTIFRVPASCVVETHTRLIPRANRSSSGLFVCGECLATQCETQGFRRIAYAIDRPDARAVFQVRLVADRDLYPVLLAGGKEIERKHDGLERHSVTFLDETPKPCYLFALVAGRLVERTALHRTLSGREIRLSVFAKATAIDSCAPSLEVLSRAMQWEEHWIGIECDVATFSIVGLDGFPTAMENPGLNLYATEALQFSPRDSTDDELTAIELTIAHEYFHQLSGNRVGIRNWFEKPFKEGLTRMRDRWFSEDSADTPDAAQMRRLSDLEALFRQQYPEDDGLLAHPVMPTRYVGEPDFITPTIYDKGGQLLRMIRDAVGVPTFARALKRLLERFEGKSATLNDLLTTFEAEAGRSLAGYEPWFHRAGRPSVHGRARIVSDGAEMLVTLERMDRDAADGREIPVRVALLRSAEQPDPSGHTATAEVLLDTVLSLSSACAEWTLPTTDRFAKVSWLRGASAPVSWSDDAGEEELRWLVLHDDDPASRQRTVRALHRRVIHGELDTDQRASWVETFGALLVAERPRPGVASFLLDIVDGYGLLVDAKAIDVDGWQTRRRAWSETLTLTHRELIVDTWQGMGEQAASPGRIEASAMAVRRLRNLLLRMLCEAGDSEGLQLAAVQLSSATSMTDRVAALQAILRHGAADHDGALSAFLAAEGGRSVAINRWCRAQAEIPSSEAVVRVGGLLRQPTFDWANVPRVIALMFSLFRNNFWGLHQRTGEGYELLGTVLGTLDAINPHGTIWLLSGVTQWNRFDPGRREAMHTMLRKLGDESTCSKILGESLRKLLDVPDAMPIRLVDMPS